MIISHTLLSPNFIETPNTESAFPSSKALIVFPRFAKYSHFLVRV